MKASNRFFLLQYRKGVKSMFRKIVRSKQELSKERSIQILKEQLRGVLSVLGDDDYPYGMPLNHYYNEEDGNLYFHGAKSGHRVDAMKRHDKASYCVMDEGFIKEGDWALNISSVIVFGRLEIIEDEKITEDICRKLSYKFTTDDTYISDEINRSLKGTLLFRLVVEHISGKIVNEK